MDFYVSHIRKCCLIELRKIAHLRPLINEVAAKQLVLSFIMPKFDYCNSLLFNITQYNIDKLQLIQNHAARLIKQAPKISHVSKFLKELHWLPIKQRIDYKIAVTVFHCLYTENYPSYLKELITPYKPQRTLRSSSKCLLVMPKTSLRRAGERSFTYAAPAVWNPLPEDIKISPSIDTFKKKLKTHLFKDAFSE